MTVLEELAGLDARHGAAVQARRDADAQERVAREARTGASQARAQIERDRATGDKPSPVEVKAADSALRKATAAVDQPWPEMRKGRDMAIRDAERARYEHIQPHAAELLQAEYERAEPLARGMFELASRVVELRAQLAAAEERTVRLVHLVHPGEERRVLAPRSDVFVRAAQELLARDGERVPRFAPHEVTPIGAGL